MEARPYRASPMGASSVFFLNGSNPGFHTNAAAARIEPTPKHRDNIALKSLHKQAHRRSRIRIKNGHNGQEGYLVIRLPPYMPNTETQYRKRKPFRELTDIERQHSVLFAPRRTLELQVGE